MIVALLGAAGLVLAFALSRKGSEALASKIPTCEIRDGVVLNVDGSLARGFSIAPLEYTRLGQEAVEAVAGGIAALCRQLSDGVTLQLVIELDEQPPEQVREFAATQDEYARDKSAAASLCRDVASCARATTYRTVKMHLFVCEPYSFQKAGNSVLRRPRPSWPVDGYAIACEKLKQTSAVVERHLGGLGLALGRATDAELLALVCRHLNPGKTTPSMSGVGADAVSGPALGRSRILDPILTLRERMALTHFTTPRPTEIAAGETLLRVLTLKDLPDSTHAGMLAPLFFELRGPATVSLSFEMLPTEITKASLKWRRKLAMQAIAVTRSTDHDASTNYKEIDGLLEQLSTSSVSLCALQLSIAVRAKSEAQLEESALAVEQLLSRCGGLSSLREDYAHLDAYMAMLPGAAHRFRRTRTVMDINAAHFFLPFGASSGSANPILVFRTRSGDAIAFDPFDDKLPAWNGLVVGASGSGKSFSTNLLLAHHLARGGGAVVVDIGGSYKRLTSIFGGSYIEVGRSGAIGLNPFPAPGVLHALAPEDREARLEFLVGFVELLTTDDKAKVSRAFIASVLSKFYAADAPGVAQDKIPTLLDVRQYFDEAMTTHAADTRLRALVDSFALWTDGPRAALFAKPLTLAMDDAIVAIDLKAVEGDKDLQAIALYVLSFVIWDRLATKPASRQTLIVFDECWALLDNPPAARLIESLVRTTRKYGAGLWCLSQSVEDFASSAIGPALLANSHIRLLLRHAFGHERVADVFQLSENGRAAFQQLGATKGEYAEAFLQFGAACELVQILPSPLGYWMATTSAKDKAIERRVQENYPGREQIEVLTALATSFPRGATA